MLYDLVIVRHLKFFRSESSFQRDKTAESRTTIMFNESIQTHTDLFFINGLGKDLELAITTEFVEDVPEEESQFAHRCFLLLVQPLQLVVRQLTRLRGRRFRQHFKCFLSCKVEGNGSLHNKIFHYFCSWFMERKFHLHQPVSLTPS